MPLTPPGLVKVHQYLNDLVLDQFDKSTYAKYKPGETVITANLRLNIFDNGFYWLRSLLRSLDNFFHIKFRMMGFQIVEMNLFDSTHEEIITGSDFCLIFREAGKTYSYLYQAKMIEISKKNKNAVIKLGNEKDTFSLNKFKVNKDGTILAKVGGATVATSKAIGKGLVKQYEIQQEFSKITGIPGMYIFYSNPDVRFVDFAAFFSLTDSFAHEWNKLNVKTSKKFDFKADLGKVIFNMKETTLSTFLNQYGFGDLSSIKLENIKAYYDQFYKFMPTGVDYVKGEIKELRIKELESKPIGNFCYFSAENNKYYTVQFHSKEQEQEMYLPRRLVVIDLNL